MSSGIVFDFWACQRPLTRKWGSGEIYDRLAHPEKYPRINPDLLKVLKKLGPVDMCFGKTDGIPSGVPYIDKTNNYDWNKLPFPDNHYKFGYWDPPYDSMHKPEGMEIWRTCRSLAILHTYVWARAWLKNAKRIGMVAVTMGPLKQIRCLQVFEKEVSK